VGGGARREGELAADIRRPEAVAGDEEPEAGVHADRSAGTGGFGRAIHCAAVRVAARSVMDGAAVGPRAEQCVRVCFDHRRGDARRSLHQPAARARGAVAPPQPASARLGALVVRGAPVHYIITATY